METTVKANFDFTPFLAQLFKTQAYLETLTEFLLTDEQKEEFDNNYIKNLKNVMRDFMDQFPDAITDSENLRKSLDEEK